MIIGITPYLYFYNTTDFYFFKTVNLTEKPPSTCADGRIAIVQSICD